MIRLCFPVAIIIALSIPLVAAPPVPGVDASPFGAQTVWPSDPDLVTILDRMQEAGIRWARFDLCWWGLCESVKGVYNFTSPTVSGWENWNTDRAITLLRDRGIEPFPILCYGNDHYDNGQGPYSDEGRKAFGNYCYEAAGRYRGRVSYWEIWNEPNIEMFWGRSPDPEDYAKLVRVAAGRIREANPEAVIAGGATAGVDFSFLETCFQNGMLEDVDIVTVHPYRFSSPESVNSDLATIRSMIDAHTTKSVDVWSGEWGYNTYVHAISEKVHAKCLARMMVNNLSRDVGLSVWFSTHAFPESSGSIRDPEWGLLDYDYNPRPAFYALKSLNARLPAPVRSVADPFDIDVTGFFPNPLRVEVFEHSEGVQYTVALWEERWKPRDSTQGRSSTVSLAIPEDADIRAFDALDGTEKTLDIFRVGDRTELREFHVMDYPYLLEIKIPRPMILEGLFIY